MESARAGQLQTVARLAVEECGAATRAGCPVEAWTGVTTHSVRETLANLEYALELDADAAVVAPSAIADLDSPLGLPARRVSREP